MEIFNDIIEVNEKKYITSTAKLSDINNVYLMKNTNWGTKEFVLEFNSKDGNHIQLNTEEVENLFKFLDKEF